MHRYLQNQIEADLKKKMVFLGGPRQVGKTTLAQQIGGKKGYLNWDIAENREAILKGELPPSPIWIFDEIHKYKSWRNYLKGLYDKNKDSQQILVTGSARLDYYRRGGDSLQGRYHYLRLYPISLDELHSSKQKDIEELLELGGFPEPFLSRSKIDARRWSREYRTRLFQEDILPIENIEDVGNAELLMIRLPDLVGSPLSINALREDLRVSFKSVSRWLDIFERFYVIFRLKSFGGPRIKSSRKSQKHYHFDWTLVQDPGARFENMMASHLLKWCHFLQDTEGRDIELYYYRDLEQREVDFVIAENRKPVAFIETKLQKTEATKALQFLKNKYAKVSAWQIHLQGESDFLSKSGIRQGPSHVLLPEILRLLRDSSP